MRISLLYGDVGGSLVEFNYAFNVSHGKGSFVEWILFADFQVEVLEETKHHLSKLHKELVFNFYFLLLFIVKRNFWKHSSDAL